MEKTIAAVTIFTFLFFAVSTALIAVDPSVVHTIEDESKWTKSSPESVAASQSGILLLSEKSEPNTDRETGDDRLTKSGKTQTFIPKSIDSIPNFADLTPNPGFVRFHSINRHFLYSPAQIPLRSVRLHPCRKFVRQFMIPREEISYGNDMILSEKTDKLDSETFRGQVPSKWLKFERHEGLRHHHHHRNHDGFMEKYTVNPENLRSLSRQHREKKREHEGSFMKRVRKFLKHTFD